MMLRPGFKVYGLGLYLYNLISQSYFTFSIFMPLFLVFSYFFLLWIFFLFPWIEYIQTSVVLSFHICPIIFSLSFLFFPRFHNFFGMLLNKYFKKFKFILTQIVIILSFPPNLIITLLFNVVENFFF